MKKLAASAAEDLLEIFVRRHEAGSTLITTNRPTQDWGRVSRWRAGGHGHSRPLSRARNIVQMAGKSYRLRSRATAARVTRAVDTAGAMDAKNAPTALSSGDDFKIGQKTPCLRTARTYAILTARAAGWFSNVR